MSPFLWTAVSLFCVLLGSSTAAIDINNEIDKEQQVAVEIIPELPIVVFGSADEQCRNDSRILNENLRNATTWAMQMWASSAKSAIGALVGNMYQMGDFDECVGTVAPIRGQYCLAELKLTRQDVGQVDKARSIYNYSTGSIWKKINSYAGDPSKKRRDVIYWALCVPASCSPSDVQASTRNFLAGTNRNSTNGVTISFDVSASHQCQTNRQEEVYSFDTFVYCGVLSIIVMVVLSSTLLDSYSNSIHQRLKELNLIHYLLCFSLKKNLNEIAVRDPENRIDCLYGMRFLTSCYIINIHRMMFTVSGLVQNYDYVIYMYERPYEFLFSRADLTVDTFFVISGITLSYLTLLTMDKRKPNFFMCILQRYVRLVPVYASVIFFFTSLIYHIEDGPMWDKNIGLERSFCQSNWWTNLLFINNYVNDVDMCLIHSWSLACDMHFYIIGLAILYVVHDHPKTGYLLFGVVTAASLVIPFSVTYLGRKPPFIYSYPENLELVNVRSKDLMRTMYTKTHTRASPYLVGMAVGYFLYRTQEYRKKFTWQPALGIFASSLICLGTLLVSKIFQNPNWEYNVVHASLFAGLNRFVWAVGTSLFILSIVFSEKSLIGSVLSSTPMIVLSKLGFSMYLVHLIMQSMHAASMRGPIRVTILSMFFQGFVDIVGSILIALVLYLTVEAPTRLIYKRLTSKTESSTKKDS